MAGGDNGAKEADTDKAKSHAKRPARADKGPRPKRKFPYRKVAELEAEIFEREDHAWKSWHA